MKIFFHASIFAKNKFVNQYKSIVNISKHLNHEVFSDHILKRDYKDTDKFTREQHQADFQRLTKQIMESDAVIIEGTAPSIGTGHYMTIALNYLKPVLVLYQNEPHGVLVGDPNRLLVLKKYNQNNIIELEKIIKTFCDSSQNKLLKNRFNLMLDDEMVSFLDQESRKLKLSKADVVRRMISTKSL